MKSTNQLKKLLLRLDGAADSEVVEFDAASGRRWQAEICLYAGTDAQAGRPKVLFRCLSHPEIPQRYTSLPASFSKVPSEAADEMDESDLRELLATSVKV